MSVARIPAEERRRRLVEAAYRVMVREGVAAGTTRAIVAEAGMPLSTFHYCFRSRDELLRALIDRLSAAAPDVAAEAMRGAPDPVAALHAAADAYLGHLIADPGREQVVLELNHHALRTPGLRDLAAEQYRRYVADARRLLAAAGGRWTLDLDELARLVVIVLDGVTTTWLADRDTEATRAALHRLVDLLGGLRQPDQT